MKKTLLFLLSLLTIVSCYDDSALRDQIEEQQNQLNDHAQRLDSLETLCARLNTNYASLKKITAALDEQDQVTGVAPIMEGTQIIGYTLTFKKNGAVTIYNGKFPQMKVEGGNWLASYDAGKTWVKIGATDLEDGESYIENVRVDAQYMYLTLSDDKTEVKIPLVNLPPVMTVEPGYGVAIFRGKAFPTSPDYKVGVVVGESEEEVKEIIAYDEFLDDETMAFNFAEDGSFEIGAGSYGNRTNFYRTFAYANGIYTWSDLMTFESNNAEIEYEVSDVTICSAIVKGKICLKYHDNVTVRVGYSVTDEYGNYWDDTEVEAELASDGTFSVTLENLRFSMMYRCWLMVRYDEKYEDDQSDKWSGNSKSFTTVHPYDQTFDLDCCSAIDLSSAATANSYILSSAGLYKFKTVKGNSTESVGSVASASILWESFGTSVAPDFLELIRGVCCENGYIAFQTSDVFKEGNAVIAAKDASGNILWSWHIWLTDSPQAHVYNNNAGTMMDRNLGATSAIPGDVGTLGLLYQWGRKDPFLGSSSISDDVVAKSTITWPSYVSSSSSTGTIDYATANPTTFISYNSINYDWQYNQDNTRWQSEKTIYDPCPAGWRVPDGGSNGVWRTAGFDNTTYDGTNEGFSFSISSPSTTWYPASGCRYSNDGSLNYVGDYGYCWSASPNSNNAYLLGFSNYGFVDPSNYDHRARGYSVRCLQE